MGSFNDNLSKVDTNDVETYILGDFNMNLGKNGHYIFQNHNLLSCHSVPKKLLWFLHDVWHKAVKWKSNSNKVIIDHILASSPDRVTQRGILSVELSDRQLIYCTRKVTRIKRDGCKHTKFRSFQNYTIDGFQKALVKIIFPVHKNFDNVNNPYWKFILKLNEVIDKVAPFKNKRTKRNSEVWFHSEISGQLIIQDKLFKKYKKPDLM